MSIMNRWQQQDFSGGENQSTQPDLIGENQVVEMVNFLPRKTDMGLELRPGFEGVGNNYGDNSSPFVKTDTYGRDIAFGIYQPRTNQATIRCYWGLDTSSTDVWTKPGLYKVWWSDWDGNRFLFSNEEIGLYTMSTEDINGTNTPSRVMDKESNQFAPSGMYLTQHKGRLYMVGRTPNRSLSTVWVSGSSDATNARYESWSGLSASSGGSFDAVPYGTDITGLASTFDGLVIFKEDRILLHTFNEDAAPWDSNNARLDPLVIGMGCVSHESIDASNDILYFVGRTLGGELGVYSLAGSNVELVSAAIPKKMKAIINSRSSSIEGKMVDDYYIVFARMSSNQSKQAVACLDLRTGAWSSFETPSIVGVARYGVRGLLAASEGGFYTYPSTTPKDGSQRLTWRLTTRRIVSDSPASDAYWRIFQGRFGSKNIEAFDVYAIDDDGVEHLLTSVQHGYIEDAWSSENDAVASGDSLWGDDTIWQKDLAYSDVIPFNAWNDGTTWDAIPSDVWDNVAEYVEFHTDVDLRSNGLQFKLEGDASSNLYFDYIEAGFRDRRQRNERYA